MNKEYLGDGVYVQVDDAGSLVVTTEDGVSVTNRIVLDLYVLAALDFYVKRQLEMLRRGREDA